MRVIGNLRRRDAVFFVPWIKFWIHEVDEIILKTRDEDASYWNSLLEYIEEEHLFKIIIMKTWDLVNEDSIISDLDCFPYEDDIEEIKECLVKKVSPRFRVADHFFTMRKMLILNPGEEFPEIEFEVGKFEKRVESNIIVNRYRFVGDERVADYLPTLGSEGQLYLRNVWTHWVQSRSIEKALKANFGSAHPFARANKEFRYHQLVPAIYHPRPIQSRLEYFNQERK